MALLRVLSLWSCEGDTHGVDRNVIFPQVRQMQQDPVWDAGWQEWTTAPTQPRDHQGKQPALHSALAC